MKMSRAMTLACMRFMARAEAFGSPREVVYWMPAHTIEATITIPTPLDKKRIMPKAASIMGLPLFLQPMSIEGVYWVLPLVVLPQGVTVTAEAYIGKATVEAAATNSGKIMIRLSCIIL